MSSKGSKVKIVLTIINIVLILVCVVSTIIMLLPIAFQHISKQDQLIFGNYLYINNNNNLTPVMKKNDLVVVKPVSITQLAMNDFLCYYSAEDPEKSALFGKIVGFSDEELELSDKAGHSTTVKVEDIIVVGKATSTVIALGDVIVFFHSPANRTLFYIIVGVTAAFLIVLTIVLHVILNRRRTATLVLPEPPASYSLEELIQVEDEVEFEKAPQSQEILF